MKLLMVARRFAPDVVSGAETVFANLYREALDAGHDVQLVSGFVRDRTLLPDAAIGVDLRTRRPGLAHLALRRAARTAIERFDPTVVLASSIEVPVERPTVCFVHDLAFGRVGRGVATRLRERYYLHKGRKLDRVVVPSQATALALLRIGLPPQRVLVVPNGVDLGRFCPGPREVRDRMQLAVPARILAGKGQDTAIEALALLEPDERRRVHLTIAGAVVDGGYLGRIRQRARSLGLPVSFHLDVPDLVPFYRAADLVLFPTALAEGFGYTAVEAMACGRPVAWTDQPAVREATGGIGFPVTSTAPTEWRDAIRQALQTSRPYEEAGARGRRFVTERYGWDRIWRRYEAVLNDVCGQAPPAPAGQATG